MVETEATGIFLLLPTLIVHGNSTSPSINWVLKLIKKFHRGSFHLGHHSFVEASEVSRSQTFWGDNVRDGGKADVVGFGIGADVAEPLLSDNKGNEKMGVFFEDSNLQRFIIGFMWPRPGYGMATTWQTVGSSMPENSIFNWEPITDEFSRRMSISFVRNCYFIETFFFFPLLIGLYINYLIIYIK